MGAVIEIKYFNSFLLKKTHAGTPTISTPPVWNGSTGVPSSVNTPGSYPVVQNTSQPESCLSSCAKYFTARKLVYRRG
jgi:hypothetical protein